MEKESTTDLKQNQWVYLSAGIILVLFVGYFVATKENRNTIPQQTTKVTQAVPTVMQSNQITPNKTTILSVVQTGTEASSKSVQAGETATFDIAIQPGQNMITFLKLEIQYDPTKLEPINKKALQISKSFPSILEGPIYTDGKILVTVSTGVDPANAVIVPAKVATVSFKALEKTETGSPTIINLGPESSALSIAQEDSASENVIANIEAANLSILP